MNYEEFKSVVESEFMNYMPEELQHLKLNICPVLRVNETKDALTFWNPDTYNDPNHIMNIMMANSFTDEQCDAMVEANVTAPNALKWKRLNGEGEAVVEFGYPILVYGTDVIDERNAIWNDIFLLCQNAQAQFITGELDPNNDADWNSFLESINKAKLDRLIEIEQESYDAIYK